MSFESGNTSVENIKETQLPSEIIEICSQLEISPEQMKKLNWLPPESLKPIFIQLQEHVQKMEQIPITTRNDYVKLLTQETLVA